MITRMQAALLLGVPLETFDRLVVQHRLTVRFSGPYNDIAFFDEAEVLRLKRDLNAPQQTAPSPPDLEAFNNNLRAVLKLIDAFRTTPKNSRDPYDGALTLGGASSVTGLSNSTLRKDIKDGRLRAKKIDRVWRIKRSDLYRYFKTEWTRRD